MTMTRFSARPIVLAACLAAGLLLATRTAGCRRGRRDRT